MMMRRVAFLLLWGAIISYTEGTLIHNMEEFCTNNEYYCELDSSIAHARDDSCQPLYGNRCSICSGAFHCNVNYKKVESCNTTSCTTGTVNQNDCIVWDKSQRYIDANTSEKPFCYCSSRHQEVDPVRKQCVPVDWCSVKYQLRFCSHTCKTRVNDFPKCECPLGTKKEVDSTNHRHDITTCIAVGAPVVVFNLLNDSVTHDELANLSHAIAKNSTFVKLSEETYDKFIIQSASTEITNITSFDEFGNMIKFAKTGDRLPDLSEPNHMGYFNVSGISRFDIDLATQNIYFLRTESRHVYVCDKTLRFCKTVIYWLRNPVEIAIDSNSKYLFVADNVHVNGSIVRTDLNGDKPKSLKFPRPVSHLLCDSYRKRLFFYLPEEDSVWYTDYKTMTETHRFYEPTTPKSDKFIWMDIFDSALFVLRQSANGDQYMDVPSFLTLLNPSQQTIKLSGIKLTSFRIVHQSNTRPVTSNTRPCEHLQIAGVCLCMDGYKLTDSTHCVKENLDSYSKILFYQPAYSSILRSYPLDVNTTICPANSVSEMYGQINLDMTTAYDSINKSLFISDGSSIHVLNLTSNTIVKERFASLPSNLSIEHMAVHSPSRTLYVYSASYQTIIAIELSTYLWYPIHIEGLYISALTIDEIEHRLYYRKNEGIYKCDLNGTIVKKWIEEDIASFRDYYSDPETHSNNEPIQVRNGSMYYLIQGTLYTRDDTSEGQHAVTTGFDHILDFFITSDNTLVFIDTVHTLHYAQLIKAQNSIDSMTLVNVTCPHLFSPMMMIVVHPGDQMTIEQNCSECDHCKHNNACQPISNLTLPAPEELLCGRVPGGELSYPSANKCDGRVDCLFTFADELNCDNLGGKCGSGSYQCANSTRCIYKRWTCDHTKDCPGGDDESCPDEFGKHFNECMKGPQAFICDSFTRCITPLQVCDGVTDCEDATDERQCSTACSSTGFLCNVTSMHKRCIPRIYTCDGHSDCSDNTDESLELCGNQTISSCQDDEFNCGTHCIPSSWKCDGTDDCGNNEDESDTLCQSHKCEDYKFKCQSSTDECILANWRCDFHRDCSDGSDEKDCPNICGYSQFMCPATNTSDGKCIDLIKVCDQTTDCRGGEDESILCGLAKDQCEIRLCGGGNCYPLPAGNTSCICPSPQMILDENDYCRITADSCRHFGTCSQRCDIVQGKVRCSCSKGFILADDRFTCLPNNGEKPALFSANKHSLLRIDAEPGVSFSPMITGRSIIGVDFHYEKRYVFWTDVLADKLYRGTISSSDEALPDYLADIIEIVSSGLPATEGIAVDWLNGLVFWMDSSLKVIEVADINGKQRATIIQRDEQNRMFKPRSLSVDPRVGYLFWADWGNKEIMRSDQDGKNQKTVFSVAHSPVIPTGGWSNGLTLDYDSYRVYWIDAKSDTIQTILYDGSDFRLIISPSNGNQILKHPFAITVFSSYVYWSDWRTSAILRANKWNGSDVEVVHSIHLQPFDLKIYHEGRQPIPDLFNTSHQCGKCDGICMRAINKIQSCVCPHLHQQDDSGKCQPLDAFLVYANRYITGITLAGNQPSRYIMPIITPPVVSRPYLLEYDMNYVNVSDRRIIWADEGLQLITSADLKGGKPTVLADLNNGIQPGIAVDQANKLLYIGSYSLRSNGTGCVDVMKLDGTMRARIVTGLQTVDIIKVDPVSGRMYVYDAQAGLLYQFNMDGSNKTQLQTDTITVRKTEVRMSLVKAPSSGETVHSLYFGDKDSITRFDMAPDNVSAIPLRDKPEGIRLWTVHRNHSQDVLYYVKQINKTMNGIYYAQITNDTIQSPLLLKTVRTSEYDINDMSIFMNKTVMPLNCESCNSEFMICVPGVSSGRVTAKCLCVTGYEMNSAKKCKPINPLLVYSTEVPENSIHGLTFENNEAKLSLADIPQIFKPSSLSYFTNEDVDEIYWIDSGLSINKINRDLTQRQTIITGFLHASQMDIDTLTGNIYWTDASLNYIEVCNRDGTQRYVLQHDNITKTSALAVYSPLGYIFYVDTVYKSDNIHTSTQIVRITQNKPDSRRVLFEDNAGLEVEMKIDKIKKRVYWCVHNGYSDKYANLSSMNFDGTDKKLIMQNVTIRTMTVHNGVMYYFERDDFSRNITKATISDDGVMDTTVLKSLTTSSRANSVMLLDRLINDRIGGYNPCSDNNGGCTGLCLYNGDLTKDSHCVCPYGKLTADLKNCTDETDFLVFSKVNGLQFSSTHPHKFGNPNKPMPDIPSTQPGHNIIAVSLDSANKRIFYSDIDKMRIFSVNYTGDTTVHHNVTCGARGVEGLAYSHGVLYFTSLSLTNLSKNPTVSKISVNPSENSNCSTIPHVLVRLQEHDLPRAIAVHECYHYIYWTNWNAHSPSIQRSLTNGQSVTDIVTHNIKMPNSVIIDYLKDLLYWADASLDKIEQCDLDGIDCHILMSDMSPHVFSMALHDKYLYWTDWMDREVKMSNLETPGVVMIAVDNLPRQPMGIAVSTNITCISNPCYEAKRNGTCDQTCDYDKGRITCGCFGGYSRVNGSCVLTRGCNSDYECNGECIPWELTCDGIPHCTKSVGRSYPADEDPAFCLSRKCPSGYVTCHNRRCVRSGLLCDGMDDCGDYTDELNCNVTCHETAIDQFKCRNGQCINKANVCDGIAHCSDISDELLLTCNISVQPPPLDCTKFEHPFYGPHINGIKCENTSVCIVKEWICDGINDCWDGSDERDCNKTTMCATDEVLCTTSPEDDLGQLACILATWRCDGENDCLDGSDEKNCDRGSLACTDKQFKCDSGECIPAEWKCDGYEECTDGSDELELACTGEQIPPLSCSHEQFKCANNRSCIPLSYRCDGASDCADNSDEFMTDFFLDVDRPIQCSPSCQDDEFKCSNGRCVHLSFYCDHYDDCGDHSDEPSSCAKYYEVCNLFTDFKCESDHRCIPLTSRCDGIPDCSDESDESRSTCPNRTVSGCNESEWRCLFGNCIDKTKLCDGYDDCGTFHDEFGCGINECMEANGGCLHICTDDPIGFHCSCYQGYQLSADNRTCVDIDECLHRPCSQSCVNTQELFVGYSCVCAPGFVLAPDRRTCKITGGIVDAPYLIVSNRYYIRRVALNSTQNNPHVSIILRTLTNAVGLDFDGRSHLLYYSEPAKSRSNISRTLLPNISPGEIQIDNIHRYTLKHPDGIAVDWIGRNLYWADNWLNTIQVSRLDGLHTKVLLYNLTEPRSVQVHPPRGYLFYTDWGQSAHIGRVNMDGTDHRRIINSTGWPNALAVDVYAHLIYYGDAKLNFIARADLDGANIEVIVRSGIDHIFSMVIFESQIFWSDWGNGEKNSANTIRSVNIFNTSEIITLAQLIHRPMELKVVHFTQQPSFQDNPCSDKHCTGLCLLKPQGNLSTAVCSCPDHHDVTPDGGCIPHCPQSMAQCRDDLACIQLLQVCDGFEDCRDGSDEQFCTTKQNCSEPFQLRCPNSSRCIDAELVCDGNPDCDKTERGENDETLFDNCSKYTCLTGYYLCNSSTQYKCVEASKICNRQSTGPAITCPGVVCDDHPACSDEQFMCANKRQCIPYIFRCDKQPECNDGSDESDDTCRNVTCKAGYSKCASSAQCIPNTWLCDGEKDCVNGTDESEEYCHESRCTEMQYQCSNKRCIPKRWVCDYQEDCLPDGDDERNCSRNCSESEWPCLDGRKCIHQSQRCDRTVDCADSSDETSLECQDTQCDPVRQFTCKSKNTVCIPNSWKCDSTPDCRDSSDELDCTRNCSAGMFRCNNSLCIPQSFICDGQPDCVDASDETNQLCSGSRCLPGRYRCRNNKCIPSELLCDGVNNCHDNSDENNTLCTQRRECNGFLCPSDGSCIDGNKVCDGKIDCPDPMHSELIPNMIYRPDSWGILATDETNQNFTCRRAPACALLLASASFERSVKRDQNITCGPLPKCSAVTSKTSTDQHIRLVKLACAKGYEVDIPNSNSLCNMCIDKNECNTYGTCIHLCSNTAGSYRCQCQAGFHITNERTDANEKYKKLHAPASRYNCALNSDEPEPYMLIADGNLLRSFDMSTSNGTRRTSFLTFVNSASRIDSIVVDTPIDGPWAAYMLSYHSNEILQVNITSLKLNGNSRKKRDDSTSTASQSLVLSPPKTIKSHLTSPTSLAYDWVHSNLYWTDDQLATITVMNVLTQRDADIVTVKQMKEKIQDSHKTPRSITIEPVFRMRIYWIDCCEIPRIWSASLSGDDPRILTDKVLWPTDIVADVGSQRLYWTDAKHSTLHTINMDGGDQRTIYTFQEKFLFKPAMIDIFHKDLILTSADRESVITISKLVGVSPQTTSRLDWKVLSDDQMGLLHISDVVIVHPRKQIKTENYTCKCGDNTIATAYINDLGNHICECMCSRYAVKIPGDVSRCVLHACMNNGTLSVNHHTQQPKCLCERGYAGTYCEYTSCLPGYCLNGATCETLHGEKLCLCAQGYTGSRCEFSRCRDFDCPGNHGNCKLDDGGVPYCSCSSNHVRENCSQPGEDHCGVCQNGADCVPALSDTKECDCKSGYTGERCESCIINNPDTGPPTMYSCFNNGACYRDNNNKTKCRCLHNNLDPVTQCQHSICKGKCLNGGTCSIRNGRYSCECPPYFGGVRCERRSVCIAGYCKNGGGCAESPDPRTQDATCHCTSQHAGDFCEVKCDSPCSNGTVCQYLSSTAIPECACPVGRYGVNCSYNTRCNRQCFNEGLCDGCADITADQDCGSCCKCRCPNDFTGSRCEDRVRTISKKPDSASSSNHLITIIVVCVIIAVIIIILVPVIIVIHRRRQRQNLFAHMALRERTNVLQISNPMYNKLTTEEDFEEQDSDLNTYSESSSAHLSNPLVKTKKSKGHKEEKSALLSDENTDS